MPIELSHNEIWSRLRAGDKGILVVFYEKYYLDLMNYGLRLVRDRLLVNDAITQVLLRLWDKREALPVIKSPRYYLLTCLRHQLYASLKSEQKRNSYSRNFQRIWDGEEPSYEEYLIDIQTNKILQQKMEWAFGFLSEREKQLLRMRYFEDMDYDEIAEQCKITKRTAYNTIHASLKTLRTKLLTKPGNDLVPDATFLPLAIFFLCQFLT